MFGYLLSRSGDRRSPASSETWRLLVIVHDGALSKAGARRVTSAASSWSVLRDTRAGDVAGERGDRAQGNRCLERGGNRGRVALLLRRRGLVRVSGCARRRHGFHGHDGIRELAAGWSDSFDSYRLVTHQFRDLGDTVVALGEMVGVIKGSNATVRQPMGSVVTDFHGGRIGETRFFLSWEATLEAVGLSEQDAHADS